MELCLPHFDDEAPSTYENNKYLRKKAATASQNFQNVLFIVEALLLCNSTHDVE